MPAIKTINAQWADVYALSGIAPGQPLLVQNQSGTLAISQISATAPDPADNSGRWIQPGAEMQVDAGAAGLWIRCSPNGVIAYVQVQS